MAWGVSNFTISFKIIDFTFNTSSLASSLVSTSSRRAASINFTKKYSSCGVVLQTVEQSVYYCCYILRVRYLANEPRWCPLQLSSPQEPVEVVESWIFVKVEFFLWLWNVHNIITEFPEPWNGPADVDVPFHGLVDDPRHIHKVLPLDWFQVYVWCNKTKEIWSIYDWLTVLNTASSVFSWNFVCRDFWRTSLSAMLYIIEGVSGIPVSLLDCLFLCCFRKSWLPDWQDFFSHGDHGDRLFDVVLVFAH